MILKNCLNCDLAIYRKNIVSGVGTCDHKLMIIGEAPGYHEDKKGIPFVGASGKLLNTFIKTFGFNREDVYITNIVKCRPPGNREPYNTEISRCLPYIGMEIKLYNPKIIVLLGNVALRSIFGQEFQISKDRGKFIAYKDIYFIATFHPSYLLRNKVAIIESAKDWMKIQNKYRELIDPFHNY